MGGSSDRVVCDIICWSGACRMPFVYRKSTLAHIGTAKHNHSGGVAHTALYLGQTAVGVEIVHQFNSYPNIQGALVRVDGKKAAGLHAGVSASGGCPEDDARNYYAVEL